MFNPDEILEEIHRNREFHKKRILRAKEVTDPCPDCGDQLVHQECITVCHNCGYEGSN